MRGDVVLNALPDFEKIWESAMREPTSVPCPYADWQDSDNWERFCGHYEAISDGEICLVSATRALASSAFRRYKKSADIFVRVDGGKIRSINVDTVYRYVPKDEPSDCRINPSDLVEIL